MTDTTSKVELSPDTLFDVFFSSLSLESLYSMESDLVSLINQHYDTLKQAANVTDKKLLNRAIVLDTRSLLTLRFYINKVKGKTIIEDTPAADSKPANAGAAHRASCAHEEFDFCECRLPLCPFARCLSCGHLALTGFGTVLLLTPEQVHLINDVFMFLSTLGHGNARFNLHGASYILKNI